MGQNKQERKKNQGKSTRKTYRHRGTLSQYRNLIKRPTQKPKYINKRLITFKNDQTKIMKQAPSKTTSEFVLEGGLPLAWLATLLKKTKLSFARGCLLVRACGWGWKFVSSISTGTPSGLNLCRPRISYLHWVHTYISPALSRRSCFLCVFHPHWLIQSSLL